MRSISSSDTRSSARGPISAPLTRTAWMVPDPSSVAYDASAMLRSSVVRPCLASVSRSSCTDSWISVSVVSMSARRSEPERVSM